MNCWGVGNNSGSITQFVPHYLHKCFINVKNALWRGTAPRWCIMATNVIFYLHAILKRLSSANREVFDTYQL